MLNTPEWIQSHCTMLYMVCARGRLKRACWPQFVLHSLLAGVYGGLDWIFHWNVRNWLNCYKKLCSGYVGQIISLPTVLICVQMHCTGSLACLVSHSPGISGTTSWQRCQRVFWVLLPNFENCKCVSLLKQCLILPLILFLPEWVMAVLASSEGLQPTYPKVMGVASIEAEEVVASCFSEQWRACPES